MYARGGGGGWGWGGGASRRLKTKARKAFCCFTLLTTRESQVSCRGLNVCSKKKATPMPGAVQEVPGGQGGGQVTAMSYLGDMRGQGGRQVVGNG